MQDGAIFPAQDYPPCPARKTFPKAIMIIINPLLTKLVRSRWLDIGLVLSYLSKTLTNLCIALYCILLYSVILNCIVLLIYCYVDVIQYNSMHKFVGVLDNPPFFFCEFLDLDSVSVHKHTKKRTWPISSHPDLTLGQ